MLTTRKDDDDGSVTHSGHSAFSRVAQKFKFGLLLIRIKIHGKEERPTTPTWRDIDADDGQGALQQGRDDTGELGARRALEAKAEERVDDQVVRVPDEVRVRREVRQERDVHLLALRHQVVEQRLVRLLRVEKGRFVAL